MKEQPIRIGLIGNGRMGREVAELASEAGAVVVWTMDSANASSFDRERWREAQVAIDFSLPEGAADRILQALEAGLEVVSGTTGWMDRLPEVKRRARELDRGFLHANNFSIGVNLFFAVNRFTARLIGDLPGWVPSIREVHHIHKKDKPSGTAITLADSIIQGAQGRWNGWHEEGQPGSTGDIPIQCVREADVPGTHLVRWTGTNDLIRLEHVALGRKGFAYGALLAASWIRGRSGVFTMAEVLGIPEG